MNRSKIGGSSNKLKFKPVTPYSSRKCNGLSYICLVRSFIFVTFSFVTVSIIAVHFHMAEIESHHTFGIQSNRFVKKHTAKVGEQLNIETSIRGSGSKLGTVHCDEDVSSLVSYWNDPLSETDRSFQSPFAENPSESRTLDAERKYLSFEPDPGGWNNVSMPLGHDADFPSPSDLIFLIFLYLLT